MALSRTGFWLCTPATRARRSISLPHRVSTRSCARGGAPGERLRSLRNARRNEREAEEADVRRGEEVSSKGQHSQGRKESRGPPIVDSPTLSDADTLISCAAIPPSRNAFVYSTRKPIPGLHPCRRSRLGGRNSIRDPGRPGNSPSPESLSRWD